MKKFTVVAGTLTGVMVGIFSMSLVIGLPIALALKLISMIFGY